MPAFRHGRAAALTLALCAAVSGAGAANSLSYELSGTFTGNSAPVDVLLPRFDPSQGTLINAQLMVTMSTEFFIHAIQPNPDGPCGCSFTDAAARFEIVTSGFNPDFIVRAQTTPLSGSVLPGNPDFRFALQRDSASRQRVANDPGSLVGTGNFTVRFTPSLTTSGTTGFGLFLDAEATTFYNLDLRYTYTPPVPEPGTWLMAALGLGVLAARRKLAA